MGHNSSLKTNVMVVLYFDPIERMRFHDVGAPGHVSDRHDAYGQFEAFLFVSVRIVDFVRHKAFRSVEEKGFVA